MAAAAASPRPQPDVYELAQISSRRQSVTQDFGRMLEQQARERLRQQEDASPFPGGSPHGSPREGHTAPQPRAGPSALYERLKKNLPGVQPCQPWQNRFFQGWDWTYQWLNAAAAGTPGGTRPVSAAQPTNVEAARCIDRCRLHQLCKAQLQGNCRRVSWWHAAAACRFSAVRAQ